MKTCSCLLILGLLCTFPLHAQERLITFTSERNTDQSISIYADAQIFGDYTVKLFFTSLAGYRFSGSPFITVTRGRREIARLMPEKNALMYSLSYSTQYYPGTVLRNPPSDTGFIYLLPATVDNVIRISHVSSIEERLGLKSATTFFGTGFLYQQGDTVCAARAGTVYDCSDQIKEGENGTQSYKSNRNRVSVEQKDGTLAQYVFRSPIKLLVEPGDNVYPGQPIAVFDKPSPRYEVMFSVTYLDEKKIRIDTRESTTPPSNYTFVPTLFHTGEEGPADRLITPNRTFKVSHPKPIVGLELSKKEKKKLGII